MRILLSLKKHFFHRLLSLSIASLLSEWVHNRELRVAVILRNAVIFASSTDFQYIFN